MARLTTPARDQQDQQFFHRLLSHPRHSDGMSNYRRPKIKGASIFFTVTLQDRGADHLVRNINSLRDAVRQTRQERPFGIDAWVVLPDHMHCVWQLPENDFDYATRWSVIKARFSRKMPHTPRRVSHMKRREHGLWQRRFWEHHIRNQDDWQNHVRYCWHNPVKHGFVDHPAKWRFSSWHRDHDGGRGD